MANNSEQDKMDVLIRELYTLSAQDIEPHHFAVKARQLIEAEATRARIDELERNKLKMCICDESGIQACDALWHHRNNIDDRIAELKRQAKGEK